MLLKDRCPAPEGARHLHELAHETISTNVVFPPSRGEDEQ